MLALGIFRKRLGLMDAGKRLARGVAVLVAAISGLTVAAAASPFVKPGDVRSGTLLFKAVEEGKFVPAPLVGTDVDITVSGPTARTRLTQHFFNPTDGWIEGVYLFPMPENSAVDTLKMVIGGRVIIGEVQEKQKAKEIYEQAKAEGKKASLLEQERPNVFTNSVANIGPRETIVIQIEYQEAVKQSGGQFSLRVPLVVAPRYTPAAPIVQTVDFGGGDGWGQGAAPKPEDKPFAAPVLDPRENPPTNPVTLAVRLQGGFPLGEVKSHHHAVQIEEAGEDVRVIKLSGAVPADKDFELSWEAKPGKTPEAGLFREKTAGDDYLLAFVTPPVAPAETPAPRDIVFVIDNSGSMSGPSMEQAKNSLLYALKRLKPADNFNVVRFDDTMETLFPTPVAADRENVGKAVAFVARLQATGGTVMVPAMRAALEDLAGNEQRLRQVVFLTDGAISNETELFETITGGLGRSRVFMVGIGSAPNSYLMTRAAELGRGSYSYIGSAIQVEERMRVLFGKLEKPAVTDLTVKFSENGADITPKVLPDLYAGEPLTIAAKLAAASGDITISGTIGNRPWTVTLPIGKAAEGKGVSKYWARARIGDAEVGMLLGKTSRGEADRRILDLAMEHGLLTRVTSLVAVDKTPSRPEGAVLSRADIPLNLPAGWDFDKVFGEKPRSDSPALNMPQQEEGSPALLQDASLVKAIAVSHQPASATAAAKAKAVQKTANVALPQTATNAGTLLWRGFLLLLASLALALIALRRRQPLAG